MRKDLFEGNFNTAAPTGKDEVLIGKLKTGDLGAFEAVCERFLPEVVRLVKTLLPGREESVNNIVAKAFLTLFLKCMDFDSLINVRSFDLTNSRDSVLELFKFNADKLAPRRFELP